LPPGYLDRYSPWWFQSNVPQWLNPAYSQCWDIYPEMFGYDYQRRNNRGEFDQGNDLIHEDRRQLITNNNPYADINKDKYPNINWNGYNGSPKYSEFYGAKDSVDKDNQSNNEDNNDNNTKYSNNNDFPKTYSAKSI
jgi:hypothetical protein